MRSFVTLDTFETGARTGLARITSKRKTANAHIDLRREGDYVVISASYGPFEIALRPRYDELRRTFSRLQPIGGLQTARQVGSSAAYLAVGLQADDALMLRPTLVGDANGYFSLNLSLTPHVKARLYEWLDITEGNPPG